MRPADDVLREVFAERVGGPVPTTDMYGAVLARHRRRRRRTMVVAGLAAVVVLGGALAVASGVRGSDRSLPAPTPTRPNPASCIPTVPPDPDAPPLPPAVPVSQLPRQDDVRGSLASNRAVVDAAAVAGWRGILGDEQRLAGSRTRHQMDKATFRLRFGERAGAGTLALATAADRTGKIPGGTRPLPLTDGLAVFRDDGGPATVTIARSGTELATGSLASLLGLATGRPDPLRRWSRRPSRTVHRAPTPTSSSSSPPWAGPRWSRRRRTASPVSACAGPGRHRRAGPRCWLR
jgi:hypothetical protein